MRKGEAVLPAHMDFLTFHSNQGGFVADANTNITGFSVRVARITYCI